MGKITFELDDDVDALLRNFVRNNYLKSHGQITQVVEKAIREFCDRQSLLDFVDSIGVGRHVLLLYQDADMGRTIEFRFILNGVKKGLHAFYFMTEGDGVVAGDVEDGLKGYAKQLGVPFIEERVHVKQTPRPRPGSKRLFEEFRERVLEELKGQAPAYVVLHCFGVSGEGELQGQLETEKGWQRSFEKFPGSMLCNFNVSGVDPKLIAHWTADQMDLHDDVIYAFSGRQLFYKFDQ